MPRGKKSTSSCSVSKVMEKQGKIAGYELSNGKVVDVQEAVQMANDGKLSGVIVSTMPNGKDCLRSAKDGNPKNNLSNLPHEQM
ncbi:DUF3892 domain-containing protein [uncultured Clostridium sp.]|uniref:DUF3892 domain-containing protein n=1 Tax=uncultured Clostridium sp. TaxID=59620 RepID=UPI00262985F2|nr:DUF3892 domain-containing protein [uncultured Clostridium sp.]